MCVMTESKDLLKGRGEGAAAGFGIDHDLSRMNQYTCVKSKYDTPLESDANWKKLQQSKRRECIPNGKAHNN